MKEEHRGRLRVREDVFLTEVDGDLLLYGGTADFHRITGARVPLCRRIVELLSRPHAREEIHRVVREHSDVPADQVDAILDGLADAGVVVAADPPTDFTPAELKQYRLMLNYFSGLYSTASAYDLVRSIRATRVLLVGGEILGSRVFSSLLLTGFDRMTIAVSQGDVTAEEAANSPVFLQSAVGVSRAKFYQEHAAKLNPLAKATVIPLDQAAIESRLGDVDVLVAALDTPQPELLDWLNRACVSKKVTWTQASCFQDEGQVGPTVVPGVTACYACYAKRRLGSVPYFREYQAMQSAFDGGNCARSGIPPFYDLVVAYLAGEIVRIACSHAARFESVLQARRVGIRNGSFGEGNAEKYSIPETWGHAVTLEMHPFKIARHPVLKLPRCGVCGQSTETNVSTLPWVPSL